MSLPQVAGYEFRVTGSTLFFLLNLQLVTRNGSYHSMSEASLITAKKFLTFMCCGIPET